MRFVITGAAGHVSKPLAEKLITKGHAVTVVGRRAANLASLVRSGANAALGDLRDVAFLTETLRGADGVYLMLPPFWDAENVKHISALFAEGYSSAVRTAGVRSVVFLSSYGAHRLDDAGAISGMGRAEVVLNKLDDVNVLHLRAGYFYTNLLLSIDQLQTAGVIGNMFAIPAGAFTVVDPEDIAIAAVEALTELNFSGHSFKYVVSDLTGTDEIAALIGAQIGKPDLRWIKFPPADVRRRLVSIGFSEGAADEYVEMFMTLDKGLLFEDFVKARPRLYNTTIEDFSKTFGSLYRAAVGQSGDAVYHSDVRS
jgi:uncharacterized protein YbjT (DUF2867 family)